MLLILISTLFCSTRWVIINGTKYKVGAIVHIGYNSNEPPKFWKIVKMYILNKDFRNTKFIGLKKGLNPLQWAFSKLFILFEGCLVNNSFQSSTVDSPFLSLKSNCLKRVCSGLILCTRLLTLRLTTLWNIIYVRYPCSPILLVGIAW